MAGALESSDQAPNPTTTGTPVMPRTQATMGRGGNVDRGGNDKKEMLEIKNPVMETKNAFDGHIRRLEMT